MPVPEQLIEPLVPITPPGAIASRGTRGLPSDLLRQASVRLGILSLVVAALWLLGTVLAHLAVAAAGDPTWFHVDSRDGIAMIGVVLSCALFVFIRRSTRAPSFVLNLGLVYLVLMAFAVGMTAHWTNRPVNWPTNPQISWIGVALLIFAAVLPTSALKMLIVGTLAVSMNPLGMLVARSEGMWPFGSAWNALLMHYPDFLLVGVAVIITRVVTQLGRQVGKARELGSYRLTELIGRGGMGEVYKATHRMLARPAAIKLIRPERLAGADDEAARVTVKRFHREAEAAANLRSPHTVEIYDFGVTEDETLYFVMELLDGMDLESLVRSTGPLPAGRVVSILTQVCESLEEAHRAGLVHRDIKPANIHVGRLGLRHDFVKVLDFGLVKPFRVTSSDNSLATVAGQTPGTPAYMAPEMALGDEVDGRADLYALGCVAYYLLTGQLVFDAETPIQMVARHLQVEPRAPSVRTDNHIPEALEDLVLRCLAKAPVDRPASAAEVARALAAIDVHGQHEEAAVRWWDGPIQEILPNPL